MLTMLMLSWQSAIASQRRTSCKTGSKNVVPNSSEVVDLAGVAQW